MSEEMAQEIYFIGLGQRLPKCDLWPSSRWSTEQLGLQKEIWNKINKNKEVVQKCQDICGINLSTVPTSVLFSLTSVAQHITGVKHGAERPLRSLQRPWYANDLEINFFLLNCWYQNSKSGLSHKKWTSVSYNICFIRLGQRFPTKLILSRKLWNTGPITSFISTDYCDFFQFW
jgi:hypothetical protein